MRRARVSQTLELPVGERAPGEHKQAWVYRCVRDRIIAGTLQRGDRLPASRALAASWGVSRGIVELAFEQLVLEGYVASRVGWGTEVIADLPEGTSSKDPRQIRGKRVGSARGKPKRAPADRSQPLPTSARLVDTSLFAIRVWRKHLNNAVKFVTPELLAQNDPKGYEPLRESISRYLRMTRGIQCDTAQIVVTTGIRHTIDLVAKALLERETAFFIEDPGYKTLVPLLSGVAGRIIDVPVDKEGFSVNAAAASRRSGIAYVTPAHQAPLGITMSINRRLQLLAWASERRMWIVEDDYDSEFSYGSSPLPALKAIDHDDRVIHCGSFNKSLFPSLRIGYTVLPKAILGKVVSVRAATGRSNSIIDQLALARYIDAGDFARHLRASRGEYTRRRDLLLSELRRALDGKLPVSGAHAGFHFILWLPEESDEQKVVEALLRKGVYVEGLREFSRTHRMAPAIVVGYANLSPERLSDAARVMGATLQQY